MTTPFQDSGFEIISVTPYKSLMLLSRRFVVIRLRSKIGSDRIKNPTSNPPSKIGFQETSDRMGKGAKRNPEMGDDSAKWRRSEGAVMKGLLGVGLGRIWETSRA